MLCRETSLFLWTPFLSSHWRQAWPVQIYLSRFCERKFSNDAVLRFEMCHISCQRGVISYFRVCKTEWKVRHRKQEREITETLFPWVTKYTDVSLLWLLKLKCVCRSSTQHPVKVKHSISITARRQRKKSHSFRFKSVWTEPPPSPLLNNSQLTSPPLQPSSWTVNHKL